VQVARPTACALSALGVLFAVLPAEAPAASAAVPGGQAGAVSRVSVSSAGAQADRRSFSAPETSANGRYVAFTSGATNLAEPDTNNFAEAFVHDLRTGTTTLVSGTSTGARVSAGGPTLSANGRFVAFITGSAAVPEDTNGVPDVYLRDRWTGTLTWASRPAEGTAWPGVTYARISADGRHVVMVTNDTASTPRNVYVRDLRRGSTTQVDPAADGHAFFAAISPNGRYVVFSSQATNLLPADTEPDQDIFVRDLRTGSLRQASLSSTDGQIMGTDTTVSISADGSRVAFTSRHNDVVPDDTNAARTARDVFVRNLRAGTTELVSLSDADTQAVGHHHAPKISENGRHVTFVSNADDLAPGDTNHWEDVFVRDLRTGRTRAVSTASGDSDKHSEAPAISHDGRTVVFLSAATTLVPDDTNQVDDIFAWQRGR
jgi:Tol biopolymer transport system component